MPTTKQDEAVPDGYDDVRKSYITEGDRVKVTYRPVSGSLSRNEKEGEVVKTTTTPSNIKDEPIDERTIGFRLETDDGKTYYINTAPVIKVQGNDRQGSRKIGDKLNFYRVSADE